MEKNDIKTYLEIMKGLKMFLNQAWPGVAAQVFNSWAETGLSLWVWDQPELHREALSQTNNPPKDCKTKQTNKKISNKKTSR